MKSEKNRGIRNFLIALFWFVCTNLLFLLTVALFTLLAPIQFLLWLIASQRISESKPYLKLKYLYAIGRRFSPEKPPPFREWKQIPPAERPW